MIEITNEKGTFSVSAEDFAKAYGSRLYEVSSGSANAFSRAKKSESDLLDFLQEYGD